MRDYAGRLTTNHMDMRQLEIVRAVAERGSFTAAARLLNVSQSAVSRQVLLLEEELGEPLFLRLGRKVRLTAAGTALLDLSRRVLADVRHREHRRSAADTGRHAASRWRDDGLSACLSGAVEGVPLVG